MPSSSTTLSKNRRAGDARIAVVRKVLDACGLPYRRILDSQQGYRNHVFPVELVGGELVNVTLHKNEPGVLRLIRSANRVSAYAADQGLPCRQARGPIVRLSTPSQLRYGAIYNYLPGHTIPWEAYTQDHIKLLGLTMSNLHAALRLLAKGNLPNVAEVYADIVRRMEHYFHDLGVRQALRHKLGLEVPPTQFQTHQHLLQVCRQLPNQQALHMDFVRGNILFQDEPDARHEFKVKVSGILDFEKTAFGPPLLDIARTLAFLLVDCKHKPAAKVRKYFLQSGYAKRGRAALPPHPVLLEALVSIFLLYDFYKFLRHNPYESLLANEHFTRTKQLLVERGLLLQ